MKSYKDKALLKKNKGTAFATLPRHTEETISILARARRRVGDIPPTVGSIIMPSEAGRIAGQRWLEQRANQNQKVK